TKKRYLRAALAGWLKRCTQKAKKEFVVNTREKRFAFRESQRPQETAFASERLQSGALVEAHQAREKCNSPGIRQQPSISEIARQPGKEWPFVVALNPRARELYKLSIFDTGRARRFACSAIQTFIDVIDKCRVHWHRPFVHPNHLLNSAARRIRFEVPEAVGGTVIQTQAAMHAE